MSNTKLMFVKPCVKADCCDHAYIHPSMNQYAGTIIVVKQNLYNLDYFDDMNGWHWKDYDLIPYDEKNKEMIDKYIESKNKKEMVVQ